MGHLVTLLSSKKITIQDSFTRSDNATSLGNADTGQPWTVINGTAGISSNQARIASISSDRAIPNINADIANCSVEIQFAVIELNMFLAYRVQDISNFWMVQQDVAGKYTLWKRNAGTFTQMGQFTGTVANGDMIRVVMSGSSIQVYINGTLRISVSDAHLSTATRHGFGSPTAGTARFDNFRVEAL